MPRTAIDSRRADTTSKTHRKIVADAKRGEKRRAKGQTHQKNGLPYKRPFLEVDPALVDRVCERILNGVHISTICKIEGIRRQTYQRWIRLGAEGIDPYRSFYERVRAAEAELEEKLTSAWMSGALDEGDLKAIERFLSKRFPKNWKETKETVNKHEVKHSGSVVISLPDNGRNDNPAVQASTVVNENALPEGNEDTEDLEFDDDADVIEGEFREVDD